MARMIGNTHFRGPGGKTCVCCYPAPKHRKMMNRSARRRQKQEWIRSLSD